MRRRDAVELTCPAKVNLALSVASPMESGLHPIASWMVAVCFGDRLSIEGSDAACSTYDIRFDPGAPAGGHVDWPSEHDLSCRAHRLLEQRAGRSLPVSLRLRKNIPVGAGLGGGSSNAAATLVALNRRFELGFDRDELVRLGQHLGSDVGFLVCAVLGQPSVIVSGCGERLEPVAHADTMHLALVFPPLACPTPDVYRQFDVMNVAPNAQPDIAAVRSLADPDGSMALFNDLAEAACVVRPQLRQYRSLLERAVRQPVHVTGSGAAMFVLASSAEEAALLADKATAATGMPAVATRTMGEQRGSGVLG